MPTTADMHIFVYDVEKALGGDGQQALHADIDVGEEPVAYCLVCPNADTVLSCDDDGQLETWSTRASELFHHAREPRARRFPAVCQTWTPSI